MSEPPVSPVIDVEEQRYGIDQPCDFSLLCNDRRFLVRLSQDALSCDSIRHFFLRKIDAAEKIENYAEVAAILDDIEKVILKICPPYLKDLHIKRQHSNRTLHSLCAPPAMVFELVTINGEARLEPGVIEQPPFRPRIDLDPALSAATPAFRSSEIVVLEELYSARVTRVLVNGQEYCCKIGKAYYPDLIRELPVMSRIANYGQNTKLRVPILRGLVKPEDDENSMGYLMDYIRTKPDFRHLGQIAKGVDSIDLNRRIKWASQIEENIGILHKMGIYWGDAKPDNVLIDLNDDTWLIDLGGNRTEGWVSEKLIDSIEGDLEALQLIRTYLRVG